MKSEDEKDLQKKAGNPLLIVVIFISLFGFLFVIPEIYKKYNSDIAEFLGIGSTNNNDGGKHEGEVENKAEMSAYYQIGSKSTLSFNEIYLTDISLSPDLLLTFTVNVNEDEKDTIDLDELDYYLEFYANKSTFIGRRSIHGKVTKFKTFTVDVSNLDVDTTTYFTLSHIADNAIGGIEAETDESGLSSLTCQNGAETYEYEFSLNQLTKTTYKYSYANDNISEYASVLLTYQKKEKEYSEYTGVTASIVENSNTFIFIAEFDYTDVTSFSKFEDNRLFDKGSYNNIVKFKVEAEGFDCK